MKICELFVRIVERMGAVHGTPLPKQPLSLGDQDKGWFCQLNNTDSDVDDLMPFGIRVKWNGWPAGLIDPTGGVIAAGDGANEATFREWLGTAQ